MQKQGRIKILDLDITNKYQELNGNELDLIYGGKWNWGAILGVALLIVTAGLITAENLAPPK